MTADPSVKEQKLKPGTVKRIFRFALPYRTNIIIFLATVVVDAALVVATPLLLKQLIDDGVIPKDGTVVTKLAIFVGLLAIADAGFNMLGRYFSSRIGEGLIYDLRSLVFAHVQRQSIAFFTRTQTGALISRINSDVIGAQQAFTATLSGVVSNVVSLVLVGITMLILSWQITIFSLILLPVFLIPISATRLARLLKYSRSRSGSPYRATNIAPETLKRSVIVLDISALTLNDSRVSD